MAAALDRSRPFGTISGDSEGRMYEQDHAFFMADGSRWTEPVRTGETGGPAPVIEAVAKAKAATTRAKAAAPSEVDAQISAQLGGAA